MKIPKINNQKHVAKLKEVNKKFTWKYYLLAFLIPFLGMLAALFAKDCVPFGENYAILYCDEYHQYYPFFLSFRNALRNGDSLLYCWDTGMGVDFLGLIAYYLGSPLNWFSVFVPDGWTLEYFAMLVPIKLGFAGFFFAIFLRHTFQKNDVSIALFGGFYALCAWVTGYLWNIMWLDTFALLPLVVLGTVRLLRDKKYILYTIALFLAVAINYYIGFFVCIFVLLIFICYQICRCESITELCRDFLRIGVFTVLALGMTLFITMPALAALQNTYSVSNEFPTGFAINIQEYSDYAQVNNTWKEFTNALSSGASISAIAGSFFAAIGQAAWLLLDSMRQVAGNMGGALTPSFKEGLPNLYCGVGTIGMAFLFLTAKDVKLRDKLCSAGMILFLMLSFIIRQLDYIWHGFHFPNMIPYRFSFIFSFVMLYMAYRTWLMRDSFKLWQPIVAGVLSAGILLCAGNFSFTYLAFNFAFLLLYIGFFLFLIIERKLSAPAEALLSPEKRAKSAQLRKRVITLVFTGIMMAELILNTVNFSFEFPRTNITNFPKNDLGTSAAINYMKYKERNELFYRAEVTHSQTLNDGSLNGYHGITTFTSSANVKVTDFMRTLGYSAKGGNNSYVFEEGSPVSNLFLNLKYMIERDGNVENNPYFDTVHSFNNAYLLKNNAYLPLGFLAENELAELEFDYDIHDFEFQNMLFTAATGIEDKVWWNVSNNMLTIEATDNTTMSKITDTGLVSYKTGDEAGTVSYTYVANGKGLLCLELHMPKQNTYKVYLNDQELFTETFNMDQTIAVSEVYPGDEIRMDVTCKSNESGSIASRAAILVESTFRKGYDVLNASTMELTEFSNTRIEGTIDCNRDGYLYTSVCNDGNWRVLVDGEPAEIKLTGEAMIGVELTEGTHEITFIYRNKAFTFGLIASISCAAIFIGIIVLEKTVRNRKGKFAKNEE